MKNREHGTLYHSYLYLLLFSFNSTNIYLCPLFTRIHALLTWRSYAVYLFFLLYHSCFYIFSFILLIPITEHRKKINMRYERILARSWKRIKGIKMFYSQKILFRNSTLLFVYHYISEKN